jgi:beta-lactamase class D/beta-lactamase class D OXA-48
MKLMAAMVILALGPCASPAQRVVEHAEWRAIFDSANVTGTIAVRRLGDSVTHVFDPTRAARGFIPASTFKIPNSVIAFDLGIVADENTHYSVTWPKMEVESWNRAHTFRTAFKYSVVPIYQIVAREVGEARYVEWLERLQYGNRRPTGGIDHFWLDGDLRISAFQQLEFLQRLARLELPASERSQRIVVRMMLNEADACHILRAKTGLVGIGATRKVEPIGWWVGWVETDTTTTLFALNIEIRGPNDGAQRQRVARSVLRSLGALPASPCRS